jgi:membrane protein
MIDSIKLIGSKIEQGVWGTQTDSLPNWRARLIGAARILHLVIRDLLEGQLTLRAMGLVYTTLLSLVPLIAVSFSMLKGFGVHNQVEPLLLNMLAPLGDKGVEITSRIIEFVDNIKAGVLGFVGLGLLIFTVISLMQKIERAFNYTWHLSEARSFGQRFSDYLSVILIGPLLVLTALGITASVTNTAVVQELMAIEVFGELIRLGTRLIPYLLVIVAFTFVYVFVPNTKVRIGSAFVGALVAGALWETTGFAFASFVANSTKYTAIYSAFATLIIFMIWLHISWLILLVGASIAFYHQHPEQRSLDHRQPSLSGRMQEKLALLTMTLVARNYYQHQPAWTKAALAQHINISMNALSPLLDHLVEEGLLAPTKEKPPTYLPAQPPDTLTLADIINAIRRIDESPYLCLDRLPKEPGVDQAFGQLEDCLQQGLGGQTLKQLAQKEPSPELSIVQKP